MRSRFRSVQAINRTTLSPGESGSLDNGRCSGGYFQGRSLMKYKDSTEQVRRNQQLREQHGLPPANLSLKQIHADLQTAIDKGDLGAIQQSSDNLRAWTVWADEGEANTPVWRKNLFGGSPIPLTHEAADLFDRIINLSLEFSFNPPDLDEPRFHEWDTLRKEFRDRWPEEYMELLD